MVEPSEPITAIVSLTYSVPHWRHIRRRCTHALLRGPSRRLVFHPHPLGRKARRDVDLQARPSRQGNATPRSTRERREVLLSQQLEQASRDGNLENVD